MTLKEVLKDLEKMGTAQNRKVYKKHGAGDNIYGVSFANLGKLTKKIKVNHDLAHGLWKTSNSDAMTLALMITDPQKFTQKEAEIWIKDVKFYMLNYYLAALIAKTNFAHKLMQKWRKSKKEYYKHCGYGIVCSMLKDNPESLSKEDCIKLLEDIEEEIHTSPNRAKSFMNSALIAIGTYKLEKEALATAKRIGKVEVDHGDTSCKTSDAVPYIKKARARYLAKLNRQ